MLSKYKTIINPNEQELTEQLVKVMRVSKTVKGGRNFHFTALVVAGNKNGVVGYGLGEAKDVARAIQKGTHEAAKNLYRFPIRDQHTIHHMVVGKYKGTRIYLQPASSGTGNIAGSAARIILDKLGVKDVLTKIHGSTNPHNVIKATFVALAQLRDPKMVAMQRGISLNKVFNG